MLLRNIRVKISYGVRIAYTINVPCGSLIEARRLVHVKQIEVRRVNEVPRWETGNSPLILT